MSRLSCLIVIMASLILIIDAVDYCRLNSCEGKPHTMCLFPVSIFENMLFTTCANS